ncbi:MAG: exo-alpha-sialidase [Pirellulales bacterium]|nr:exo-alpha-sialidase [Pirellulales bacterium]
MLLPAHWKDKSVNYVGVLEPNNDFTSFVRYGKIAAEGILLFENTIANLSDGKLAMLIRGEGKENVCLWRADSRDGGKTWSEPYVTDIPNPGSKPRIINLPDGRIVLFHNPNRKDYSDPNVNRNHHRWRMASIAVCG